MAKQDFRKSTDITIEKLDPITGFDNRNDVFDAIFSYSREQLESYHIEMDFLNLGNLNEALGRTYTNEFMEMATSSIMNALGQQLPTTLYGHRNATGGDEASILVTGISEEELKKALMRAQDRIEQYINTCGLNKLQHSKQNRSHGLGLRTAYKKLTPKDQRIQVKNDLQEKISDSKKQESQVSQSLPPSIFHGHALDGKPSPKTKTLPYQMWIDTLSTSQIRETLTHSSKNKRGLLFEDLRNTTQESALIRININNLKGLNEQLGQKSTDSIIDALGAEITQQLQKLNLSPAPHLHHTGGDNYDLICRDSSPEIIESIKATIQKSWQTVADQYGLETLTDQSSIFIIDSDVIESDLPQTLNKNDVIKKIYGIHGISYIEHQDNNEHIVHFHSDNKKPATIKSDSTEKLHIAAQTIEPESVSTIFKLPVGEIAGYMFGIDLSGVLTAQYKIKELIANGIPQDEIEGSLGENLDEFNEYFKTKLPDEHVQSANMLIPPERTDIRISPQLRTLSLAKYYKTIPDNLYPIILSGQAAQRTLDALDTQAKLDTESSRSVLEKDIPQWIFHEPDVNIRTAQSTEKLLSFMKTIEGLEQTEFIDSKTRDAFKTIAHANFHAIGKDAGHLGYTALNTALSSTSNEAGMSVDSAKDVILAKVTEIQTHLNDEPTVLKNLTSLSSVFSASIPQWQASNKVSKPQKNCAI